MNCTSEFQRKNSSFTTLNQALYDVGTWWWWTNVIGTLCFGTIGLIGNLICFLVVCRFSLPQHSFVEYLRALAIFEFCSLTFEYIQKLNDLLLYLFGIQLMNFRLSIICKIYEYFHHVIILLGCWTIVGLTFDRLILVCDPLSKKFPNFSRKFCNSKSAKKLICILILLSLIINIPHLLYEEWVCKKSGLRHSAAFINNQYINNTIEDTSSNDICSCRISTNLGKLKLTFVIKWNIYVFHLFCYALIPAFILIASNAAILKLVHAPRPLVGQQNEHLRSKLTGTLTLVSLMFLILYFPHAILETFSIILSPKYMSRCDIRSLLIIRILRRLSELLNISALGINFFLYILGVNHYRSAAIQMLGLHHFQIFIPYLTVEHRASLGSFALQTNLKQRRHTHTDSSSIKLLKVINNGSISQSPTSSVFNKRLST